MTSTNSHACPSCGKPLQKVTRDPDSMFNAEQFDAVRAGDWFCEACPDNGRARTGYRYFWDSDLAPKLPAARQATTEPNPLVEDVRAAMRQAFSLGQTYWRQSDSDSVAQNSASDETSRKFSQLVADTCDALAAGIAQPEISDDEWSLMTHGPKSIIKREGWDPVTRRPKVAAEVAAHGALIDHRFNSIGIAENWSVTVEANGERVLCISDQHYASPTDIERFEATIESAARHLLGFIARPIAPQIEDGRRPHVDLWTDEQREQYRRDLKAEPKEGA